MAEIDPHGAQRAIDGLVALVPTEDKLLASEIGLVEYFRRRLAPPLSGGEEAVPVAWRWRERGMSLWSYGPDRPPVGMDGVPADLEAEPLYRAPSPQGRAETDVVISRDVAQALFSYGSIHTVTGVVCTMPHKEALDKLGDALSRHPVSVKP